MKNKKLLASITLATVTFSGLGLTSYANEASENTTQERSFYENMQNKIDNVFKAKKIKSKISRLDLSEDDKKSLETMTNDEKKEFLKAKASEKKEKYLQHEAVIDKLLNGESLTDEDKIIVEEIKTKRAERKLKREEFQAKMEEIKKIRAKKVAGETLTDEETELLDSIKSKFKKRKKHSKHDRYDRDHDFDDKNHDGHEDHY